MGLNTIRICQFATGFHMGDAISNEMLAFHAYFCKSGLDSYIYAEHIGRPLKKIASKYTSYKPTKYDVIVYHHSIHSNILDFILNQPVRKILIYHNVTPAHFFEPYDLPFSYLLKRGKTDLISLQSRFDAIFADSEFNKHELVEMGYKKVIILPIVYDFQILDKPPLIRNNSQGIKITFVGRISPNKKQCDLIRFAEIYRKFFRKDFQVQMIGYASPASRLYLEELRQFVRFFKLEKNIYFSGYATQSELNGYYSCSDIFLSMSEHEGFCVPLLEAMHFKIPVLAYKAGAVEETMNKAGILFQTKDYPLIAEIIEEILSNPDFKEQILRRQNQRIEEYKYMLKEEILMKAIQDIES